MALPFFSFVTAIITFIFGVILTVMVIPAPIGLGFIQFSKFLLAPYSYEMVNKSDLGVDQNPLWKAYSFIVMLLYLPFGVLFAIMEAIRADFLFISIVGIPVAIPIAKSLGVYLNPVGKVCVPSSVGAALQMERDREQIKKYMKEE